MLFRSVIDDNMQDDIIITIIASRFEEEAVKQHAAKSTQTAANVASMASSYSTSRKSMQADEQQSPTMDDLPDFLKPRRREIPPVTYPRRDSRPGGRESFEGIQDGERYHRQTGDVLERMSEQREPRVLDEAPSREENPAPQPAKNKQSRQGGRVLPWFLQDELGEDRD